MQHCLQRIATHVAPRHRAAQLTQWRNLLRLRFPEAQAALDAVRTCNDPLQVHALLFASQAVLRPHPPSAASASTYVAQPTVLLQ